MYLRTIVVFWLCAALAVPQTPPAQEAEPHLKTRTEVASPPRSNTEQTPSEDLLILAAGTKLPLELTQPVSTKGAQAGDPIYARTTFPIVMNNTMVIPAGTWVKGVVDTVKRAGRLKGTAELSFHLTTLVYPNGYTLDLAAAIDRVPGDTPTNLREPGTVKHDSEKGKDLSRIGPAASEGAQIGSLVGIAARPSVSGLAAGGLAGAAAGTLIALLARGSDVTFPTGTAVEIALTRPIAIDKQKTRAAQ